MKLKRRIIYTIVLISSVAVNTSCEDFLTETNPNEILAENFYTTLGECEMGHAALYNAFKQQNLYTPHTEAMRSDLAVQSNVNRVSFTNEAYTQSFNNSYSVAESKWAALYVGVMRANQLLEGLQNVYPSLVSDSQIEVWNQYRAEAHLFRGLFYFWLHNSYNGGSVPLKKRVPVLESEMFTELSSSEEVREFYRSEIETALEIGLEDEWSDPTDYGRVTTGTAYALLGKSYLYEGDYATAMQYFEKVMALNYELTPDVESTTTYGEFSKESILEVNYSTTYNTEYSTTDGRMSNNWSMNFSRVGGWNQCSASIWLTEAYENEVVDPMRSENWVEVEVDDDNDVKYTQLGKSYDARTELAGGGYQTVCYVFEEKSSDPLVYEAKIKKKTKVYDSQGICTSTVYKYTNASLPGITVKKEGEKYYRLLRYSPRASGMMALNGDEDLPYYTYIAQQSAGFVNREVGYFRHYCNWDICSTEKDLDPIGYSSINLRLIRLADIYLMYAECCLMQNSDTEKALEYINKVRYRAGTTLMGAGTGKEYDGRATYDGVTYSVGDLMKHLMYVERPLELSIEGQAIRVCDLRRWGVTKARFDALSKDTRILSIAYYLRPDTDNPDTLLSKQNEAKIYTKEAFQAFQDTFTGAWKPAGTEMSDYIHAAANYTDKDNAYWPIPNSEVASNPNI